MNNASIVRQNGSSEQRKSSKKRSSERCMSINKEIMNDASSLAILIGYE